MELIVKILADDDKRAFAAECNNCGWIGRSKECGVSKGHPESGCSGDIHCPMCNSKDVDQVDNEQPIATFIDRLKKANQKVKELKERAESCELDKYISSQSQPPAPESVSVDELCKQLEEAWGLPYSRDSWIECVNELRKKLHGQLLTTEQAISDVWEAGYVRSGFNLDIKMSVEPPDKATYLKDNFNINLSTQTDK